MKLTGSTSVPRLIPSRRVRNITAAVPLMLYAVCCSCEQESTPTNAQDVAIQPAVVAGPGPAERALSVGDPCLWTLFKDELPWDQVPPQFASELSLLLQNEPADFPNPPGFAVAAARFVHVRAAFVAAGMQAQQMDWARHGAGIVWAAAWQMRQLWAGARSSTQLFNDPSCAAFAIVDQVRLFVESHKAAFEPSHQMQRLLFKLENAIYDAWLREQPLLARQVERNDLLLQLNTIRDTYERKCARELIAAQLNSVKSDNALLPASGDAAIVVSNARAIVINCISAVAVSVKPPALRDRFLFPQRLARLGANVRLSQRMQLRIVPASTADGP